MVVFSCNFINRITTNTLKQLAWQFNPLVSTLPQSNGPLYSNTVIGGLLGSFIQRGGTWAGCGLALVPSPLLAVPSVTAHSSTASVPTSYYSMWHYNLPPTKEEVYVFARTHALVCLSVCVQRYSKTRAWLWMKCCVSTDVGT